MKLSWVVPVAMVLFFLCCESRTWPCHGDGASTSRCIGCWWCAANFWQGI